MTKKKEKWLAELREQDEKICQLMEERSQIRKEAEKAGIYEELYDCLYKDGKPHWDF